MSFFIDIYEIINTYTIVKQKSSNNGIEDSYF